MKQKWVTPAMNVFSSEALDVKSLANLSDAELKLALEKAGYPFNKKFAAKEGYLHRKIAGSDVLISLGGNVADFNGYIELNKSAACLWDRMKTPSTCGELEQELEEAFGISHETAVGDVQDFLKELKEHRMITVTE